MYYRIFAINKTARTVIRVGYVVILLANITVFFAVVFVCNPPSEVWKVLSPRPNCVRIVMFYFFIPQQLRHSSLLALCFYPCDLQIPKLPPFPLVFIQPPQREKNKRKIISLTKTPQTAIAQRTTLGLRQRLAQRARRPVRPRSPFTNGAAHEDAGSEEDQAAERVWLGCFCARGQCSALGGDAAFADDG